MRKLASFLLKLTRSLWMLKTVCSRFLMLFSISKSSDRNSALFSANNTKFASSLVMRDCGSFSRTDMGLSCKMDQIDTDMGSCFPNQVFVSCGFSSSDGTQIDSKSKIATFLKLRLIFVALNIEFFKRKPHIEFERFWGNVFDWIFATSKMAVEVIRLFEKFIASVGH